MYCGKRNILLSCVLLCFIILTGTLRIRATPTETFFSEYEILKEPFEHITIAEVQQSAKFVKTTRLNFGYTTDACWVKISLNNIVVSKSLYVIFEFTCLDYVNFYLSRNGKITDSLITGYLHPLGSREKMYSRAIYVLPGDIGDTDTLYVRIQKKEGALHNRFLLYDEITLLKETTAKNKFCFSF